LLEFGVDVVEYGLLLRRNASRAGNIFDIILCDGPGISNLRPMVTKQDGCRLRLPFQSLLKLVLFPFLLYGLLREFLLLELVFEVTVEAAMADSGDSLLLPAFYGRKRGMDVGVMEGTVEAEGL
jgi:hypothetical protein